MRDSICYAFGVGFAAVGSSDVTVYQEIKPIDLDVKQTGKLLLEEAIRITFDRWQESACKDIKIDEA